MSHELTLGKDHPTTCIACRMYRKSTIDHCISCFEALEERKAKIMFSIQNFEREFGVSFVMPHKADEKPDGITSFDVDVSEFHSPTETELYVSSLCAAIDEQRKQDEKTYYMAPSLVDALSGELTDVIYAIQHSHSENKEMFK